MARPSTELGMGKTVAIVQARMGSERFPGKMMSLLGGYPVLEWVLRRLLRARLLDDIILATTTLSRDDPLARVASRLGVRCFRGDEHDVLGRFVAAAKLVGADNVVRICADNPFVDPDEIDRLVSFFSSAGCDYACNHQDRLGSGYADGFGGEILSVNLLQSISIETTDPTHREHVTLYLWEHEGKKSFRLMAPKSPASLAYPDLRFDIDIQNDFRLINKLIDEYNVSFLSSAKEIIEAVVKKQEVLCNE